MRTMTVFARTGTLRVNAGSLQKREYDDNGQLAAGEWLAVAKGEAQQGRTFVDGLVDYRERTTRHGSASNLTVAMDK